MMVFILLFIAFCPRSQRLLILLFVKMGKMPTVEYSVSVCVANQVFLLKVEQHLGAADTMAEKFFDRYRMN